MFSAKIRVKAKLNLTLDVRTGENGYHDLDSFVTSLNICDTFVARKRKDKLVNVFFHGLDAYRIPHGENNATKAGDLFVQTFGSFGADIDVYRDIPMGAGLGSSSADIDGVLLVLQKLYGVGDMKTLQDLANRLGSDTAYMLYGGYARLRGRGEQVELIPSKKKLYFLLLLSKVKCSTKAVFSKFDELPVMRSDTESCIQKFLSGDGEWIKYVSNGLTESSICVAPKVGQALEELKAFGVDGVNMTGSGSCVYAVFEEKEMRDYVKSRYRGEFKAVCAETEI